MRQLLFGNQARLQQPRDKSSRSDEGVDYVNALASERLAKFGAQNFVHRFDDEIHHLNRSIDDTQLLRKSGNAVRKNLS